MIQEILMQKTSRCLTKTKRKIIGYPMTHKTRMMMTMKMMKIWNNIAHKKNSMEKKKRKGHQKNQKMNKIKEKKNKLL